MSASKDHALARAMEQLESEVCDVRSVFLIFEVVLEQVFLRNDRAFEELVLTKVPELSSLEIHAIGSEDRTKIDYLLHHLGKCTFQLHQQYFAALERPEAA